MISTKTAEEVRFLSELAGIPFNVNFMTLHELRKEIGEKKLDPYRKKAFEKETERRESVI
ncbi:MAG: hypothetical protein QXO69_02935 [archaeon]